MVLWWRHTRPSRINTQKRCPSHHRGLGCKSRKSRNTWSNRQIWPGSTEWSKAKANRVFPRERTGYSKHPFNNTRDDSTHGYHQMVITEIRLITFFAAKDREALYSQQKQDREQTVAQIMNSLLPNWLKLKKVGKTTRPFRYDLNHIPYDYTVEVTNRFKGLHLIDRVPEELWAEVHDIIKEAVIKTIPKKKKCKKAKWLSVEAFTHSWEKKRC